MPIEKSACHRCPLLLHCYWHQIARRSGIKMPKRKVLMYVMCAVVSWTRAQTIWL